MVEADSKTLGYCDLLLLCISSMQHGLGEHEHSYFFIKKLLNLDIGVESYDQNSGPQCEQH